MKDWNWGASRYAGSSNLHLSLGSCDLWTQLLSAYLPYDSFSVAHCPVQNVLLYRSFINVLDHIERHRDGDRDQHREGSGLPLGSMGWAKLPKAAKGSERRIRREYRVRRAKGGDTRKRKDLFWKDSTDRFRSKIKARYPWEVFSKRNKGVWPQEISGDRSTTGCWGNQPETSEDIMVSGNRDLRWKISII